MTTTSLQPPTVASGDRVIEQAVARTAAPPINFQKIWDPQTCPAPLLPWLAWGLSIDIWEASWSEATKRQMIAEAIARQRRKGSVKAVREVLDAFAVGLSLHEWFEPDVQGPAYTFEVRLPIESGETTEAAFVERVFDQIVRVKPARAHFTLAQTLRTEAVVGFLAWARAGIARRLDAEEAPAVDWTNCLLTEFGEPMFTESGARLEKET